MPDPAKFSAPAPDRHNDDDIPSNPSATPNFGDILNARIDRRAALGGAVGIAALGAMTAMGAGLFARPVKAAAGQGLTFTEIAHGTNQTHRVAPGYDARVLIRWGDPVEAGAPEFDPLNQSAAAQSKQFGYNNDFVAFMPLPTGSANPAHGLLCVNHEYTSDHLMFPGLTKHREQAKTTQARVDIEMAAHGHSVIEIERAKGAWRVVTGSPYNRRLTALATPMRLAGPAAGHARLKTKGDPNGREVIGTLNNCAGGVTPWGTVLIAEENFHGYFGGDPRTTPEARNYKRYGLKGRPWHAWHEFHARFHVEKEPNEANRFGWIVEFNPYDPRSVPVKRTALGRFKHEGATSVVNKDGRVVLYSGDDQRFEYIYKFVTSGRFDPKNRAANRDLLDSGTLYAARFKADGTLDWLPLVWGTGPLTPVNGFASQAEVLIETRRAADLLGATPMDRPEDVETNPVTGTVYAMLTNNTSRGTENTDAANPRAKNRHGHILEMIPPGGRGAGADHGALTYRWDIPVLCGDPAKPGDGAKYHPGVSADGWFSNPDNCAFDDQGNLWIATDGSPRNGFADGIWAMAVEGDNRALTRHFLRVPRGAEMCGPAFTPGDETLFAAVQHPGADKGSTFDTPSTRWPDFDEAMPPRPAVLAVTKRGGGRVGS